MTRQAQEDDEKPEFNDEEVAKLKEWVRERDSMKAQGRVILWIGVSITGAVGWIWGEEIKALIKGWVHHG